MRARAHPVLFHVLALGLSGDDWRLPTPRPAPVEVFKGVRPAHTGGSEMSETFSLPPAPGRS